MVEMPMCIDYIPDLQPQLLDYRQDPLRIRSGIDNNPFTSFFAAEDETVDPQLADYDGFEYHVIPLFRLVKYFALQRHINQQNNHGSYGDQHGLQTVRAMASYPFGSWNRSRFSSLS